MTRRVLALGITLAAAVALVGCSDDTGDVVVSYTIGVSGTCDDARIASVRLILEDNDGEVSRDTAPCADHGQISAKGVPVGSYIGTLEGLSSDGIVTHRSAELDISVRADDTTNASARLSPIPATLRLAWSFPDGRMCNHPLVAVDEIIVEAFDENNAPVTFERGANSAACTDAFLSLESDDFHEGNFDVLVTGMMGSVKTFQDLLDNVPLEPGTVTDRIVMMRPCAEQPDGVCR